jgi:site-specific recombinase XerD
VSELTQATLDSSERSDAKKRPVTVPRPRKPTRRFPAEPLGLADVEALRAACSRRAPTGIRNRALIAVLFRSGLRISEALALLPKDLDSAGGSLRVLHGKGDKARTAPLPSDAAEAVDRWLDCRKRLRLTGRHPLFCTLKGEPLWDSYVRTLCKRLAAKAGIEKRVHPHGLRHGWALGQVQSGTSLNAIQQLLGHRSLHTTSVYLQHIAPAAAVAEATAKTAHLAVQP